MVVGLSMPAAACSTTSSEASPQTANDAGVEAAFEDSGAAEPSDSGVLSTVGGPVELGTTFNARQTGGLVTSDGQTVRDAVLIRSGQLTDESVCAPLETLGVRTVIDLRGASEVAADPDAACVGSTATYYNADVPKILPPGEAVYLQTLDATEPKLAEIFARLGAEGALPAVIHCVIGRDRASLTMALVLLALGVPQDRMMEDFETNQATDTEQVWMTGVLQRIEQAGGIEAYLGQHGVTAEQLQSLRAMALR